MSLWSRFKKFIRPERPSERPIRPTPRPEPEVSRPPIPVPPPGGPAIRIPHWTESFPASALVTRTFALTAEDHDVISHRPDVVWQTWKEERIRFLERLIVERAKSLRGHPKDDFAQIVEYGHELEMLRPAYNWKKDLASP